MSGTGTTYDENDIQDGPGHCDDCERAMPSWFHGICDSCQREAAIDEQGELDELLAAAPKGGAK